MAKQDNIIGAIELPMSVLKKILPKEGDTAVLGTEQHSKVEYKGVAYIIHWVPAIQIMAIGKLDDIDKEILNAENNRKASADRKQAVETLKVKFNELTATVVND
jgi:hypothetical protein